MTVRFVAFSVALRPDQVERIDETARSTGESRSALVRRIVDRGLNRPETLPAPPPPLRVKTVAPDRLEHAIGKLRG